MIDERRKTKDERRRSCGVRRFSFAVRRATSVAASAQVVVEYAIVFPILLLMTLLIIQLAHIFVAKQVVSYASFCGARAALVGEDYQKAASMVCSPITGLSGVRKDSTVTIPGWGALAGSGAAAVKTHAELRGDFKTDGPAVTVEVTHDFELTVPVADTVAYHMGEMFLTSDDLDFSTYGAPHIRVRSSCTLAKPWQ